VLRTLVRRIAQQVLHDVDADINRQFEILRQRVRHPAAAAAKIENVHSGLEAAGFDEIRDMPAHGIPATANRQAHRLVDAVLGDQIAHQRLVVLDEVELGHRSSPVAPAAGR